MKLVKKTVETLHDDVSRSLTRLCDIHTVMLQDKITLAKHENVICIRSGFAVRSKIVSYDNRFLRIFGKFVAEVRYHDQWYCRLFNHFTRLDIVFFRNRGFDATMLLVLRV